MEASYPDEAVANLTNGFAFGKQTEQWYGVEYFVSPLLDSDVKLWETEIGAEEMRSIHLPEPNRYIPRNLDLCEELPEEARVPRIDLPVSPPKLIVNNSTGRLWHKLDERYALPKAYITVLIRTRAADNKPTDSDEWEYDTKTSMQSEFLKNIFADSLAIDTYDAYLAGLGWSLTKTTAGFTLTCHGYSDRLSDLALKLLKEFASPSFMESRHFATAKDKTVRGLSSFFESKRADSLAIYYRNLLMNYRGDGVELNLEIARAITLKDVEKHHVSIWADNELSLEVLYTGNVSEKQARSFFSDATDVIERTCSLVAQTEAVKNDSEKSWVPGECCRHATSANV
jgi:insulysin